jgi:hypothetical protein
LPSCPGGQWACANKADVESNDGEVPSDSGVESKEIVAEGKEIVAESKDANGHQTVAMAPATPTLFANEKCNVEWATCGGDGWEAPCCGELKCVRSSQYFAVCSRGESPSALALMAAPANVVSNLLERYNESVAEAIVSGGVAPALPLPAAAKQDACNSKDTNYTNVLIATLSLGCAVLLLLSFGGGWLFRGYQSKFKTTNVVMPTKLPSDSRSTRSLFASYLPERSRSDPKQTVISPSDLNAAGSKGNPVNPGAHSLDSSHV